MKRAADYIKNYAGTNPFGDNKGSGYSDTKISNEFFPISTFWSLFNDQHEILLGSRGSGKTFLLKMMRYSMLKRVNDIKATELVKNKEYIALYVPMHLEFVTELRNKNLEPERKKYLFYFLFNCLLAESLIRETIELVNEVDDPIEKLKLSYKLSNKIYEVWFGSKEELIRINSLDDIIFELKKLYYNFDLLNSEINDIPAIFRTQLCSILLSVKEFIASQLCLNEEPTWIVCIDEAEFLDVEVQRCINSFFRSDSSRIVLKVATLPFYHTTLQTLDPNVQVSKDNDFSYRIVDMKYDSQDFISLTNKLCSYRLTRVKIDNLHVDKLEDFLGTIGNDDLIDYYRHEVGKEKAEQKKVFEDIVNDFSEKRKVNCVNYPNKRKTIYDKFAPVFFVRKMYNKSKNGNSKPGWYAGSNMARKIAQGNPRLFISIMNGMFDKACSTYLTPKAQHEILMKYVDEFCNASKAIEKYGPLVYSHLMAISNCLHDKTHSGNLTSVSHSFIIDFDDNEFDNNKGWIERAIAFSRLMVTDDTLIRGLDKGTRYTLSNAYAARYWIPMRNDSNIRISLNSSINSYEVKTDIEQLSLF